MKKLLLDCGAILTSERENNRLAILLNSSTFNRLYFLSATCCNGEGWFAVLSNNETIRN